MRICKINRVVFTLIMMLVFSGCVSQNISDLEDKIAAIMSRPGGRIEPLPEITPYDAYTYKSGKLETRDPFQLFYEKKQTEIEESVDDGLTAEMEHEIKSRNKEELEIFELDGLRMVGTLENVDNYWGIVIDPDGIVHRVSVGNYMGLNIGKITNIYEDRIELREIVQDGYGRWEEREASLALIEE